MKYISLRQIDESHKIIIHNGVNSMYQIYLHIIVPWWYAFYLTDSQGKS